PQWSIQVLGGWTNVEYDTTRNNGAISSSFDATRIFGSAAIVGNIKLTNKLVAAPKLAILHLAEDQDGTTDSAGNVTTGETIDLGRISFGGTLSYLAGGVSPFIRVLGEYDYAKEDAVNLGNGNFSSDDEFGINATVGLNMNFGNGVTGNVEATSATLLRDNLDVYTVSGRIRYTW
ncbi:MAG: autotransporter domain-containing protein, partial [Rhodospirillaceae bacterium]|nr:autotransporter domain-containing protein [Rhodospirillaceae bacterium]